MPRRFACSRKATFEIVGEIVILAAGCNSHRADGVAGLDLRAGYLQHFRHAHLAVRNTLGQKRSI